VRVVGLRVVGLRVVGLRGLGERLVVTEQLARSCFGEK
jgi:hypothetical protein